MTAADIVYVLCVLTSLACAVLLWRGYRRSSARLLMWSSLCFVGLALNNALVFFDLVVVPDIDLAMLRSAFALIGLGGLLFALIWDTR